MADLTPDKGQLLDWSALNPGGVLESGELTESQNVDSALRFFLHIDMAHKDTNAAGDPAGFKILISAGDTDEDWHEMGVDYEADGGSAVLQALAAASGPGQAYPERIELAETSYFETPGASFFLLDDTIVNSEVIYVKSWSVDDYVRALDNLSQDHDASDSLSTILNRWTIRIPTMHKAKVLFYDKDDNAAYACRVQWSCSKDIE